MDEARILNEVCRARRGIKPAFTASHVFLALRELLRGPIGRICLSRKLGLGEASTRTLINRLKELGLVEVDKVAGVILTEKGLRMVRNLVRKIVLVGPIDISSICRDTYSEVAIIRDGIKEVERLGVLYLRDLLVKYGARGGIILYYRGGSFLMPTTKGLELFKNARIINQIVSKSSVFDGDVIVVALCSSTNTCLNSLINAVIDLLKTSN